MLAARKLDGMVAQAHMPPPAASVFARAPFHAPHAG